MSNKIAGLILADQDNYYRGTLKPLLPFGRTNVLETATEGMMRANVQDIFVVLGHEAESVKQAYAYRDMVQLVHNPSYEDGVLSSIRAGIQAIGHEFDAFLLMPLDCLLVETITLRTLLRLHYSMYGKIIVPVCDGRRGFPWLVSMRYAPLLLNRTYRDGLDSFLMEKAEDILPMPTLDYNVLTDLDIPGEYERALGSIQR